MKDFRHFKVWQKAHSLVLDGYGATRGFPEEERFGLTSQIRRSAVSIPSNIAEGCGRLTDREFRRFLGISGGSLSELDYQLLLANDLTYLPVGEYRSFYLRVEEVKRMTHSLIERLTE